MFLFLFLFSCFCFPVSAFLFLLFFSPFVILLLLCFLLSPGFLCWLFMFFPFTTSSHFPRLSFIKVCILSELAVPLTQSLGCKRTLHSLHSLFVTASAPSLALPYFLPVLHSYHLFLLPNCRSSRFCFPSVLIPSVAFSLFQH